MALELIRESIKVNQLAGEGSTQTIIENDIIVPDVKPDIARILNIDADVYVGKTEVGNGKITASGVINYKILYVSDDEVRSVKGITTSCDFSEDLHISEARQGMNAKLKCDIEHIDYELANSRKLNAKVVLKFSTKIMDEKELDLVTDISGVENLQVLRSQSLVNCFIENNEAEYSVAESFEIPFGKPSIKEILRNDIKLSGKEYQVTDNKLLIRGELNISTLYIGDDEERSIQSLEYDIPFSQVMELPEENGSLVCDVDYKITDAGLEVAEDNDGEPRVLNYQAVVKLTVSEYAKREVEILEDAYSPRSSLNIDKEPFEIIDVTADEKTQISLRDSVLFDITAPEVKEIFNVTSRVSLTDYSVYNGKVIVEGVVDSNILYLSSSSDQPLLSRLQETPFRQTIDVAGVKEGMKCDIDLDIHNSSCNLIAPDEVELRVVIDVGVKTLNKMVLPEVVKVDEVPLDEKRLASRPSITIYFTQEGDTLWKVAKRYLTTIDDIRKINNIDEDKEIIPGQQLIIPRKSLPA